MQPVMLEGNRYGTVRDLQPDRRCDFTIQLTGQVAFCWPDKTGRNVVQIAAKGGNSSGSRARLSDASPGGRDRINFPFSSGSRNAGLEARQGLAVG
jgi:hypothetical protein